MDELKKYFRQHETEMRQEMPDENRIWERLEAHRQKNNRPRLTVMFTMRFAAAACLVLLLGFGIWQWTKEDKKLAVSKAISQNTTPIKKDSVGIIDSTLNTNQSIVVKHIQSAIKKKTWRVKIQPAKEKPIADGYARLVEYQLDQLRSTPVYAESPEYFRGFSQQLQQMDEDEMLLKKDIESYGMNDHLLEALINIYQQKLNLLKILKAEIHKMNKTTKEKQMQGRLPSYYLNL